MSSVYPSIPDPTPTVESLAESVRTLKMAVELLTGQRAGGSAAHTFAQETTPTALQVGDLWVIPSTGVASYWDGANWLALNPATTTVESVAVTDNQMQAFSAYASSSQSINNTWAKLQCNVEEFDTDGRYSTGSYRFNPSVAGLYLFVVAMQTNAPLQNFATAVYKNGAITRQHSYGAYLYGPAGASMVWLNGTTDYVEPYGYCSAAMTTTAGASNTYFQGCLLRAD